MSRWSRWLANVRRWLANVGRSFVQQSSASARRVPGRLVYVNVPPRLVRKYLLPTEKIVISVRMHPMAVISPVIVILAGAVAAGFVTGVATRSGSVGVAEVIWVLWAVLAVWQGWKVATWWRRYFVVTENRLMLITSLVDTDVGMMPLAKVTDMRLHQNSLGQALGYAEFIVESAGQDQALSRIPFVPYPSQMYQEILSLIFSSKPRGGNGGDLCLNRQAGISPPGNTTGQGYGACTSPTTTTPPVRKTPSARLPAAAPLPRRRAPKINPESRD